MTYQESVKENAEEYLKHVPSQGITRKYEYTNILIGTSIMQLLAVIADELHEMNNRGGDKAEPVRHGHYVKGDNGEWYCSECRRIDDKYSVAKYCWYCGAKMDEVENETD